MKTNAPSKLRGSFLVCSLAALLVGASVSMAQNESGSGEKPNAPASSGSGSSGRTVSLQLPPKGSNPAPVPPGAGGTSNMFNTNKLVKPIGATSVYDALEEVSRSKSYRLNVLSTNSEALLRDIEYRVPAGDFFDLSDFCTRVLPDGYRGWPESEGMFLFVGTDGEVSRKLTDRDIRRLANNNRRIRADYVDWSVYSAIEDIRKKCGALILTQEMEEKDKVSYRGKQGEDSTTVDFNPSNAVPTCRRITFTTDNQEFEWRTVLGAVLEPDYTFYERDGKVRVMTKAKKASIEQAERDAVRMEMRYVRIHHANPEDIVKKISEMTGIGKDKGQKPSIFENAGASIQVAPYPEKFSGAVNSFRHSLSSSSSSLSTGNSKRGETSSGSSGNWGNLLRPKSPPAILIYDNPDNLDRLEALVKSLDVREKQVLVEALILDLSDDGLKTLGMNIDQMGFGSVPILGVNWSQKHESSHTSDNEGSWSGGTGGGTYLYRGKGRGTTAETAARTTTSTVRDQFSTTTTTSTEGGGNTGIAPSWAYGTVSEAFASRKTGTATSYEKTSSSIRDRGWSTIFGPLNFNFVLDLVQTDGDSKVLSSPVLTIGDHSEAMVHVGNVRPVAQIETTIVAGGVNNAVAENVEWYELVTGIMMWVGPEVTEDGKSVRLWIHPKLTTQDGEVSITVGGNTLSYPSLTAQEIDTRVTVPSGGTLLLGGLVQSAKLEQIKRVPLLGDIPLLGRLFRWTSTSTSRRNLVIMVRPTVLDDDEPVTGFEEPANKIIDPMTEGLGRTLVDVGYNEEDDPMKRREKAILEAVGLKKKDDASATADAAAEAPEDTDEEAGTNEPSVTIETTVTASTAADSASAGADSAVDATDDLPTK